MHTLMQKSPLQALHRAFAFGVVLLSTCLPLRSQTGDLGNGRYRNPIVFADYSDPDVIRVGHDYYMVASTFHFMPGIPILHSRDLVNWQVIAHVYPRLDIDPKYDMQGGNRYGRGAWAPAIRLHAGRFYVYFPTPDEGIFMSSSPTPTGPWTKPVAVIAGPNLEDPCPFWDDDGKAYLMHSKLGAGPLILHRMSPDGTHVLDEGKIVMDNPKELPTLEGPKIYKMRGWYYVFAPYGGVETGAQAVLRSRHIDGPYEFRTVLAQGNTDINGPHQGGYIETPEGTGWFLHFQQRGPYGRIIHLEPVRWADDWPVIGEAAPGAMTGSPVAEWTKPVTSVRPTVRTPFTSDEFNLTRMSQQWEWNHNPDDAHWSLTKRPGFLRLQAMSGADLLHARNTLTELSQDADFEFEASFDLSGMKDGEHTGITMFSDRPSWIGVVQSNGIRHLDTGFAARNTMGRAVSGNKLRLKVVVSKQMATYSVSLDGGSTFEPMGEAQPIFYSWWKGVRPALFNFNTDAPGPSLGYVDVDWVHYRPTSFDQH